MPRSSCVPALSRLDVVRSLRIANGDVAFATAFVTLTTGTFLVGFVQSLHGSDLWIGVLSAIPSLVGILQIPGAIWGRRYAGFKSFVTPGGWLWRLCYLPIVALPILAIENNVKLLILTVLVMLASISINLVNPIYNDWMAEIVPPTSRGTFFGRRNGIAAAVSAVVGFLGAMLLDWQRHAGHEHLGYALLFGLGLICSFISLIIFLQMPEARRENPIRQNLRSGILAVATPFGDREYRRVLGFLVLFVFAQMFAGNLYVAFARESLKLDFRIIQATALTMAVGTVAGASIWGFVSDRYGNKPVLALAGFGLALLPIPWMSCRPGHVVMDSVILIGSHVFMGLVWSGINLCQFNLILSTADRDDRANYIAAAMAVAALVGGVSPLVGAGFMSWLRTEVSVEVAYKTIFGTTSLLRLVALGLLIPVREEGSTNIRRTIKDLRNVTPKGFRAIQKLRRTSDGFRRVEAIERVGEAGTLLATDEIAKALQDPVPRVRRQAAMALARLQDNRAVHDLVRLIDEHPDLLEEETVDALGLLRDPSAVPTLIRTLSNPRSILRRAAARALGRIGHDHPEAVNALANAASDRTDPDLRRAALQAMRLMGAGRPAVIIDALIDPLPSVRIAAAEAVAELNIEGARPVLRESLARFNDEASSEVAYALGVVGDREDLPIILSEVRREESPTARRRALMGAARVLGVEPETYRLLLLDGLARDEALLDMVKPAAKGRRRLQVALERYSVRDEEGALEALVRVHGVADLVGDGSELVLIAFALAAKPRTEAERSRSRD